jgi:hypothetical protein
LAVFYYVEGLESGVAFVVLINVGSTAGGFLSTDKVEVCDTRRSELGLEVGPPASLE